MAVENTAPAENAGGFGENINFYTDWIKDYEYRTGLNVQCVISRQGQATLNLEIAPIAKAGTSPSWGEKITLQLTKSELIEFCALLLGLQTMCKGAYHGADKNKGFTIHDNSTKGIVINLTEAGRSLSHLVGRTERAELAVFVARQLAAVWKVTVTDVWGMLPKIYR